MSTRLPFEILALIIDIVAADTYSRKNKAHDTTNLRNCALVSAVLTVHCQKHLFARIETALDKPQALSNLRHILEGDHPEIGSYIKVLSVIFRFPGAVVSYHGLDRILKRCTQVTELNIRSFPFDQSTIPVIRWNYNMPRNVRLELESILFSPTCTAFSFDGLSLPISLFASPHSSHTLESLTLFNDGFYIKSLVLPDGTPYSSLRFLSLPTWRLRDLLPHKFRNGQYLFDFADLTMLLLDHKRSCDKPNDIVGMLHRALRLQTLGLILGTFHSNILWNVFSEPVHCFSTTLVEIRLSLLSEWRSLPIPDKDPFAGALAGFRTLAGRNVLRAVHVELEMDNWWRRGEIMPERWLSAATTFTSPGSFPSLKEFAVEVITPVIQFARTLLLLPYSIAPGARLMDELLEIPFNTLELPYRFNFSVRSP